MTNQHARLLRGELDDKTNEVAIIGGGLAGLTAAVDLSKSGKNVTIIEKPDDFGGRARTAIKNGFYFNQGPHVLYANGLGSKIEIMRFFVRLNKMNLDKLQRISFQEWLDKNFKNSDSKDFVKMLGRISTYTYNAENLSAKLTLNQIKTAMSGGVVYIDKGWQTLVDQLVEIAKSSGVKLVHGKNVVSIRQKHDTNGTNRQPL